MFRNLFVLRATRMLCAPIGLGHVHRSQFGIRLPTSHIRFCSSVPSTTTPEKKSSAKIPMRIKIVDKVKEEFHRIVNGSKLLGQNTKNAASLMRGVLQGRTLSRRERILMVLTVSDLIRMVPFIVIVVIPFAEFALPVLLKFFPNMLPSTFTSASQKEASRARKLQAKLKVIEVLQAASENINLQGKLDTIGMKESLVSFMTKVSRNEEINTEEVIKISQVFHEEFSLESLERQQLLSLVKFFDLPSIGTSFILQESMKFKWRQIRKDDAHIVKDGIDTLTPAELEEAAITRGYSHTNSHQDQKQYLREWISLSQENVPPYLLLLSRVNYFVKKTQQVADITPPIIAPYIPALPEPKAIPSTFTAPKPSMFPNVIPAKIENVKDQTTNDEKPVDIPEKEIVSIEFKNLSHELSEDPVAAKLWDRVARFTSDLKKETFGGREEEVIHLGDASGESLSTVITTELRQYLQATFIALDKDGDRKLTVDEVEHGLNASDISVSHQEAEALVQRFDTNGDKCLHFDEFVDCLLYLRKNRK